VEIPYDETLVCVPTIWSLDFSVDSLEFSYDPPTSPCNWYWVAGTDSSNTNGHYYLEGG